MKSLFRFLAAEGAVITGPITLALMIPEEACWWVPDTLDIIVPSGRRDAVEVLMKRHGFQGERKTQTRDKAKTNRALYLFSGQANDAGVNITESNDDGVIKPILNCGNTAMMNMLTPYSITSFYPKLTSQGKTLLGPRWKTVDEEDIIRESKYDLSASICTRFWEKPCGYEVCPAIGRRVRGLRGIAVWNWDGGDCETHVLHDAHVRWAVNKFCYNMACPNFHRYVWGNEWSPS